MAWKPGQTGNPNGRPKNDKIITQRLIAELHATSSDGVSKLHRLCNALLDKAIDGDVRAITEVIDRIEGKATQPMEHSGKVEVEHSGAAELLSSRVAGVAARLGTREPAQITH